LLSSCCSNLTNEADVHIRVSVADRTDIDSDTETAAGRHPEFKTRLFYPPANPATARPARFTIHEKGSVVGFVEVSYAELYAARSAAVVKRVTSENADLNARLEKRNAVVSFNASFTTPIAVIANGGFFTAYVPEAGSTDKVTVRQLHVFYEPEEKGLGHFFWGAPGARNKEDNMPFNRISDVYQGVKHPVFKAPVASTVNKDLAFTVATKQNGLHLVAPNEQTRAAYLQGVKDVLVKNKIDASKAASPKAEAPKVESKEAPKAAEAKAEVKETDVVSAPAVSGAAAALPSSFPPEASHGLEVALRA
jgi:hypothetical protein